MNELQFRVDIRAARGRVWDVLWRDETFRQWASIIDPGTYMVGELKEGNEVQFISAENGYGVTSLIEKLVPNEFLLLRHSEDTQGSGEQQREKQWTGGKESYRLTEKDGTTTLTATFDVPPELEEYFKTNYPKALQRVKELAEGKKWYCQSFTEKLFDFVEPLLLYVRLHVRWDERALFAAAQLG